MNSVLGLRAVMFMKKTKTVLIFLFLPLSLFTDSFSFSGESMETVLIRGREKTILSGNAKVQSEDNNIEADHVELYGEDYRFVRCKGRVNIINKKKGIELSAHELFYDRHDKVVRVNGKVVMIDKKNEIVVKGSFLEYWEDREETIIQIGVRILKEDLVCRSEFARYLRDEEKLELSGVPVVNWKGDEYRALKIFVDLKQDTIRLEGDIRGKVTSGSEESTNGEDE